MRTFDELFEMAAARKGGAAVFAATLPQVKTAEELAAIPDDRWLSEMSKGVFRAGFSWKVIDQKWPGFEAALWGFDVGRCSMMSDDDLDALLADTRVVRHAKKLLSVRDNAIFLRDLAAEHGTAARAIADWPDEDYAGLLAMLKKRASRMGGTTGPYVLRFMGKDGFIPGGDVAAALIREGVVDKPPTSQRDMAAAQAAISAWAREAGRPMAHVSRVLACTVG